MCGLNLALDPKAGAPALSYQLARMRHTKEGEVRPKSYGQTSELEPDYYNYKCSFGGLGCSKGLEAFLERAISEITGLLRKKNFFIHLLFIICVCS